MNDNPFALLDEIGRIVEEMEDFSTYDYCTYTSIDSDYHGYMFYHLLAVKDRDLTVIHGTRGVYSTEHQLVLSLHFENGFLLHPILMKIASKEEMVWLFGKVKEIIGNAGLTSSNN